MWKLCCHTSCYLCFSAAWPSLSKWKDSELQSGNSSKEVMIAYGWMQKSRRLLCRKRGKGGESAPCCGGVSWKTSVPDLFIPLRKNKRKKASPASRWWYYHLELQTSTCPPPPSPSVKVTQTCKGNQRLHSTSKQLRLHSLSPFCQRLRIPMWFEAFL